jgi:glucose/arabinose dehydrogenase
MHWRPALLATIATLLVAPATASAAALIPLAPSSTWNGEPTHAASPPGDPRLFVLERDGGVRVVKDGVVLPEPFLTVPNVDTGNERGLLSIAFAPDYATSGYLYLFTVAAGDDDLDPAGQPGDIRVVEYRRSDANPDRADPASARLVLKQPHSAGNHNGGQLAFGPDGLLYITIGDNANAANAQDLGNRLGKVLRIDPRGGTPYGVPSSNPFFGNEGAAPEIYALGLRNPYRASFGPAGELIVADVGAGTWEEVNVGRPTGTPATTTLSGENLGWPSCEGACAPANPLFTDPFFQYANADSPPETSGCAVLGGVVVRDLALSGLTGRYLYGDLCRADLRTLDLAAAGGDPRPAALALPGGSLRGFGEDGRGCVYAMSTETVYRIGVTALSGTTCPPPPPPGPGVAVDSDRPGLRLKRSRRQRLRRFVEVRATCDEACTLRAMGRLRLSGAGAGASARTRLRPAAASAAAGAEVRLRLRLTRRALKRARAARADGRSPRVRVTVVATDAAGNASKASTAIVLR